MRDVIVIGAGPAGLSAAKAVAETGLSCLCIDRMGCGGALMNHGQLHDCPEADGAEGPDFGAALLDGALGAGAELVVAEVTALSQDESFGVTADDEVHRARAVVLAPGMASGRLGLAEEDGFEGQGLSRCAACDGPIYRDQPVAVAGTDRWAVQEAVDLAGLAQQVTLLCQGDPAPDMAPLPNVAVLPGHVVALEGDGGLEAVLVEHEGQRRRVPSRAIFVQSGRRPALGFAEGLLTVDDAGRVSAAAPGLFVAGDARSGAAEWISAALADGRRAGLEAAAHAKARADAHGAG